VTTTVSLKNDINQINKELDTAYEIVGSNPTEGMDVVCCECCVLSGRDLCDELIIRPEESYRLWCVVVCNLETS
jgi:hypothetical protein